MKLVGTIRKVGKRVVHSMPILRRHILASTDYRVLSGIEEARRAATSSTGWLTTRTVTRQERAYRDLIATMKSGRPRLDFEVAVKAIAATEIAYPRVLEVGCGSGYYSEVFSTLLPAHVSYTGIDYSAAMIARARAAYPSVTFEVADATRLPYADSAFDVVFNGVSLMHILDYQAAVREAARVAGKFCILHTVPVFSDHPTTFLQKYAYGAPVVEVVFNKRDLMSLCRAAGLCLEQEWPSTPYDVHDVTGHHSRSETYLFKLDRHELKEGQ